MSMNTNHAMNTGEPSPHIRAAGNADEPAVRALVFGVLRDYGLNPDPAATDRDLDDIECSYRSHGGGFDVMTTPDGTIIGTVGLMPLGDGRCELRKMYLAPAHRGRGLGRRLLMHALDRARALGFRRVELETAAVLTEAIALYRSFGFAPFTPDHLAPRCDQAYFLDLATSAAAPGAGAPGAGP